jgi:hypothetical protein
MLHFQSAKACFFEIASFGHLGMALMPIVGLATGTKQYFGFRKDMNIIST